MPGMSNVIQKQMVYERAYKTRSFGLDNLFLKIQPIHSLVPNTTPFKELHWAPAHSDPRLEFFSMLISAL